MKKTAVVLMIVCVCVLLAACGGTRYTYPDGKAYHAGDCTIDDPVENIEINWVAGKVRIEYTSGDEINLSERTDRNLSREHKLHWRLDGKKLIVQFAGSGSHYPGNLSKELTVMLPDSLRLMDMQVNSVSAIVDVQGVCADNLTINSVSGSVNAADVKARSVDFDTVSGHVEITLNGVPELIKGESVSGGITICLPGDAGFAADAGSVSGCVSGPDGMIKKGEDKYAYGDEQCRIIVHTVSGGVQLKHAK